MNEEFKKSFDKLNRSNQDRNQIFESICKQAVITKGTRTKLQINRMRRFRSVAVACMLFLVLGSGITYAAMKWLSASEMAQSFGDESLAKEFGKKENELMIETTNEYRFIFLGMVSGKNISDHLLKYEEKESRSYIALAVERMDGNPITQEKDEVIYSMVVSPFIQGEKPWQCNVFSMNGSATAEVFDGVYYRLLEVRDFEAFADRELYLGVYPWGKDFKEYYAFDESTGIITKKETEEANFLFRIPIDPKLANPEKAKEFLADVYQEDKVVDEEEKERNEQESKEEKSNSDATDVDMMLKNLTRAEEGITYHIWDCCDLSSGYSGSETEAMGRYHFYVDVEGEGIDFITYTLNQGEWEKKTEVEEIPYNIGDKYTGATGKDCILSPWNAKEHMYADCKYVGDQEKKRWLYSQAGNQYKVTYDEQNTNENVYAISLKVPHEQVNLEDAESEEEIENRLQVEREQISSGFENFMMNTQVTVEVHKIGGGVITKTIDFTCVNQGDERIRVLPRWMD